MFLKTFYSFEIIIHNGEHHRILFTFLYDDLLYFIRFFFITYYLIICYRDRKVEELFFYLQKKLSEIFEANLRHIYKINNEFKKMRERH